MAEPVLVSNKICIVGGSIGRDSARKYHGTDWNIWCVARIYDFVSYATLVFDVHQNADNRTKNTTDAYRDRKLILQAPCSDYPEAFLLPSEELQEEFPALTSSFSWIIAYAIRRGATDIALCGVNMTHVSELETQRPGLFHTLGMARALGINIILPVSGSQLHTGTDVNFSQSFLPTLNNLEGDDMAKNVVIIGAGNGYEMIRDYNDKKEYEIWCVPTIYPVLASYRVDKIFELHGTEKWKPGIDYAELENKLIIPRALTEVPKATIFGPEALQAKYGMVFSSSIAWMVGYALANDVNEIVFLGVDMENGYSGQRDGLFFLLGFAKAAKVNIVIPETSKLNIFGKSYGWV